MMGRNHLIVTAAAICGLGYPATMTGRKFAAEHALAGQAAWSTVKDIGLDVLSAVPNGVGEVGQVAGELLAALAYNLVAAPFGLVGTSWLPIAVLVIVAVLAGALLPDIDNPASMAGRRLRIARPLFGPHRSITHANWVPLALVAASVVTPVTGLRAALLAFAVGWLGHVVIDGFSHAGRTPWWPLGRWHLGPGGVVVSNVRAQGTRLYAVNEFSEYVVVGVFVAAMAALLVLFIR